MLSVSAYTSTALTTSPEVQSAEQSLKAADATYKGQWAAFTMPTLSFTGTAYPYGHNPANSYRFNTWRLNRSDMSFNTTANWNLFNSFIDFNKLRAASLAREAAQRAVLAAKQDRAFAAIEAFYDLDSKTELLEVARQNLKAQEEQYRQSRDLYENGMKSLADLLKSETDWRSSQLRIVDAEAQRKRSLVSFNTLVDREGDVELKTDLQPGATQLPEISGDIARALSQRPEVVRARKQAEAAKVAFEQAVQQFLPQFRVDATWNHTDTANFGTPVQASTLGIPNPNYYVGLQLSLPLGFNGVSQAMAIVNAKAEQKRAQTELAGQVRTVKQEVAAAWIDLEKDLKSYEFAVLKEEIAAKSLELVGRQYRQGSADAIRMNQAQNDFLNARTERVLALRNIFIDRAKYTRAVGDPLW